jgi:poly-gamma-glutamate synthesis protein (capsule biosynthesis protein)
MKPTIFILALTLLSTTVNAATPTPSPTPTPPPPQSVTLSFVGDVTLGEDINTRNKFSTFYDQYGPDYFFQHVKQVFLDDDLTIINLEGPLTTSTKRYNKPESGPKYWHKGKPEYAQILPSSGIEIANLANNHCPIDYLQTGLDDTRAALENYGISYFGRDYLYTTTVNDIKIGFMGQSGGRATDSTVKNQIENLKMAGCDIIVANFHLGEERSYKPNARQKHLAKLAIDTGANIVIGHHPHVLQGIERYNGGIIAYSLGNFLFYGNNKDKDTMIFQVKITKTDVAFDTEYQIIPATVESDTKYLPKLLEGTEAERVLKKITDMKI